MEYVLWLIVLILLLTIKSTLKKEIKGLNERITLLKNTIDELISKETKIASTSEIIKPTEDKIPKESVIDFEKSIHISEKDTTLTTNVPPTPKIDIPIIETPTAAPIYNEPVDDLVEEKSVAFENEPSKTTYEPKVSFWNKFKENNPDIEKFIGENLINKLGVLILVLGISYFVKYAIDKDWINEPARVGIGVLAGSLILLTAHKLRLKYASFSSVLVAGAIAVYYFTIGIAFHEYQLFNQTTAFVIMVFITAFSCLISLSYNRIELAVLSLIGGFAVPFMVSTGAGNYIVLFTYITILNTGILTLAYFKKWNLVNVLAFIFTTILFGGWLFTDLNAETPHYKGAFVFAFVFYILFVLMSIINNLRTKGVFSKYQLIILSTNTFVFYGFGMAILSKSYPAFLGLFTASLSILNLIYAWFLYKKFGLDKKAVYLLIGLTLTFITLAIPVQFKGNYITLFWAIEAVLLLWLFQKSKIKSYSLASVIVQVLMLGSLVIDWQQRYSINEPLSILFNAIFITGLTAIASLIVNRYLLRNMVAVHFLKIEFNFKIYRNILGVVLLLVSYITGLNEVIFQSKYYLGTEFNGLFTLPIVYHLIFTAVFCFFLVRKKSTLGVQVLNIIAGVNILLFTFVFSKLAFMEITTNALYNNASSLAYYAHFVMLIITIYFMYLLYKTNKDNIVFPIFSAKFLIWSFSVLIVIILSTELVLEGLKIMLPNVLNTNEISVISTIAIAKTKMIKAGLPVLWGVLAFIFLLLGIKKQSKTVRIIALSLLGLTIVKLFSYDISNVSETGKIIAFILLGILILIISFVYQKIKVLVVDDKNKFSDEDEN